MEIFVLFTKRNLCPAFLGRKGEAKSSSYACCFSFTFSSVFMPKWHVLMWYIWSPSIISCTYLKCSVWWFLTHVYLWNFHYIQDSKHIYHPQSFLTIIPSHSPFLDNHWSHYRKHINGVMKYILFFGLASSTWHCYFEICPHYWAYQ